MTIKNGSYPFVSIIIPIRNEAQTIASTIDAVISQDYPASKIEILIADGNSVDDTRNIIYMKAQSDKRIHVIDNKRKIVPTGINAALAIALGEIIIRIDGHTIISPDYVRQCVETLHRTGADNVGGRMDAAGKTLFGQAVALATSSPFGVGGARFHYQEEEEWVDTVYMGAWPKRVFEQVGLFDEEMVRDQDDEFNYRLRENGGKIFLNPKIRSSYTNRSNPRALWKQYYQYGLYKVRVLQKHPRQMQLRQFVPLMFVLSVLVSILTSLLHPFGLLSLIFISGLYLLINLIISLRITLKKRCSSLLLLSTYF